MIDPRTSYSHIYTVIEIVYKVFTDIFMDENLLHINEKFVREKGFRSVVMHSNILNGFLSHFILECECLPLKNVIIQTQEIKYLNPDYLNDILDLSIFFLKNASQQINGVNLIINAAEDGF